MNDEWVGKDISIDCGDMGFFQGKIKELSLSDQTLTLKNVFKNGKPLDLPSLTIRSENIKDLTVLDTSDNGAETNAKSSTVNIKKKPKPVAESLASRTSIQSKNFGVTQPARFSPAIAEKLKIRTKEETTAVGASGVASRIKTSTAQSFNPSLNSQEHHFSRSPRKQQGDRSTPVYRKERDRMRDEDCFGGDIDNAEMALDFDFESNLALFDKKLVFDEIEGKIAQSNQPDVVRLVDCNRRRKEDSSRQEAKYRNDENVLAGLPAQYRPIETGEEPPPGEYVTDSGLVVPALSYELRERVEKSARKLGYSMERTSELVARAGVELAMQFFGGSHRLNPENKHQVPIAVVLCGPTRSGNYGLATARHLASQGVRTIVLMPDLPSLPGTMEKEFQLYKLTGQKWTRKANELPYSTVDLILSCLEDHEMWKQERSQPWFTSAVNWAKSLPFQTSTMAIDPPSEPVEPALPAKISLLPGLPLWLPDESGQKVGKLYMVNLAMPKKVFTEVGITYDSPFGAKTLIRLHRVT